MSEGSESSHSSGSEKEVSADMELDQLDINDFIENTNETYFLNNPPPSYYDVCPPTYKESSYYPSIQFNIMSLVNSNDDAIEEKKQLGEGNLTKRRKSKRKSLDEPDEDPDFTINTTNVDRKEKKLQDIINDKDEFFEQTEGFIHEVYDFYNRLNKLNVLIGEAKDKIINYTKKVKSDEKVKKPKVKPKKGVKVVNEEEEFEKVGLFIENVILHKVEEFQNNEPYSFEDLDSLKSELNVDMLNTKDMMFKYFNFKKK
jgi:hypothetical protein